MKTKITELARSELLMGNCTLDRLMAPAKRLLAIMLLLVGAAGPIFGAVAYWDTNGIAAGTGDTPNGLWDGDAFWSTSAAGTDPTTLWPDGSIAVFSAGTDGTNAFTVAITNTVNVGGITVEEGSPLILGGTINMANPEFPISATNDAVIGAVLNGGSGWVNKTGPAMVTLTNANSFSGTNIVAEGILAFSLATAMGNAGTSPTIVSNGATLLDKCNTAVYETVILYGSGVTNSGALRNTGNTPQANGWTGGAVLGSDVRINQDGPGTWTWTSLVIVGTNDGNNFNLTIGGNGSSLRLNTGRTMYLGTGKLIKEGSCELKLETPGYAEELDWNGGHIAVRTSGNFLNKTISPGTYVPATVYVGPGVSQFRTGLNGPSLTLSHPFVLSGGADPIFRPYTYSFNLNGVISGEGGVSKYNDAGTVFLNAANTYSGNTTVRGGILTLGPSGSISNSPVIDVQSGATLNVSSNASGLVLQSSQTLKGNGTIWGNVQADGTLSPGASVGSLTFSNDLTIAGNLVIEVDKSLSPSNDTITVLGAVTNAGTGTLTVNNIGWMALAAGDSFPIFNQPVPNGGALTVTSGGGVVWMNKLAVDGSIAVVSAPAPVPATNVTIQAVAPGSFQLGGMGAASAAYGVFSSTNVTLPMSSWSVIGIANSDSGGLIQFIDTQATNAQSFYRFGQ